MLSTIQVHKQLRTKTQTSTNSQGTGHLVMMPITQDAMRKEGSEGGREKEESNSTNFDLRQNKDVN